MGFFNTIFGKKTPAREGEGQYTKQAAWGWIPLTDEKQLDDIQNESATVPIVIFKHSTRCGISRMAYRNFENDLNPETIPVKCYYLDLLSYRNVSDAVASRFGIPHESPQLLLIKEGEVVYHVSHGEITAQRLIDVLG